MTSATGKKGATPIPAIKPSALRTLSIYAREARLEFVKMLRVPIYTISTLVFPLMFYVIFGLTFSNDTNAGISAPTYMLATYGAFGVIGCALFGFGVAIAVERGQGWMRLKRASPMPPAAYFSAKLAMAFLFSTVTILALFAMGALIADVRLPAATWLGLYGTLVAGSLPFSMMGLAFGYLLGPNSAPAVLNLVYLPMAFASGLWIPIEFLPGFFTAIAPYLPPYHYAQLALGQLGASQGGEPLIHLAVLAGYTLLFLVLALVGYRRDEGNTYG